MKKILALSCVTLLAGCGLNLYSLPFGTSAQVHNGPAMKFLKKGGPRGIGAPGDTLTVKAPYADGRLLFLTASGGGMRASAFTLGVLAELDAIEDKGQPGNSVFDEIDLISSVSGGSWAVSAVLADRAKGGSGRLATRMPTINGRYAELSKVKVRHWANFFIPYVTKDVTFAEVYKAGSANPLPFTYFNATLYPSHSPFVFAPAYLTHYRVTTFGDPALPDRVKVDPKSGDLASIPLGYAATASSAVPGFTSAFAETDLCTPKDRPSFCFDEGKSKGKARGDLQLMDGGVYDNLGYKTALEVALADRERVVSGPATIIMIDSADGEDFQTITRKGRSGGHWFGIAKASSFPNQNATFDRLRDPGFIAAGFDERILLDFAAAMDFDRDLHGPELKDLPDLAYYVAHDIGCYNNERDFLPGRNKLVKPPSPGKWEDNLKLLADKGDDCLAMNFVRAGYLHKTTFKYDSYAFLLRYQLGRLVVRMHRQTIIDAVFRTRRKAPVAM